MDDPDAWAAKAAIAELITRYAALNDSADWDAVAALYTADARMSRPTAPDDFIIGRAAILESFRARPPRPSRHVVANVLVTLQDATRAIATSQVLLFVGSASTDGPPTLAAKPPLIGTFHDQLVRTDDGWRFVVRRGTLDFRPPK